MKPLFLYTLNWCWVTIYWDTTYITILFIPIIPIYSRDVINLWGWKYLFHGKIEMVLWKRIWRDSILIIILISIIISLFSEIK